MSIRILLNGANGRMGKVACSAIAADPELELVATAGSQDELQQVIMQSKPQVVIDLTTAIAVYENTKTILATGCYPVIGTSGLASQEIANLQQLAAEKKLGGIIVPNFSMGAVLMMKLAAQVAPFFSQIEIIEQHHEKKVDAPSGTAIRTAELIAQHRLDRIPLDLKETLPGARGANCCNIPIHALRLPGVVAKQQVIFGTQGETLTLEHQTIDRQAFMPGLLFACKRVLQLTQLVYGLEEILDFGSL